MKYLARFVNPKYFIPIGGTIRHQRQYQRLMTELGYNQNNIFTLDEGESVWFTKNKASLGQGIETKNVYVDAYGVGDVGHIVLRDRQTIASEGMVVAILVIDNQGRLLTAPKIVSRGFVFEKEEGALYKKAVGLIENMTKPKKSYQPHLVNFKRELISQLENVFYKERGRKPLVIVEIIQI